MNKIGRTAKSNLFSKGVALLLSMVIFLSSLLGVLVILHTQEKKEDSFLKDDEEKPMSETSFLAFSGASAYGFVKTQTLFGPRPVESENHTATANFIFNTLKEFGLQPKVVTFSRNFDGQEYTFKNIVARKEGNLTKEERNESTIKDVIVFGAHYDTRDVADLDPEPENKTRPILGANDGASGVAVLLELVRVFSKTNLSTTLEFVFFDGEDFKIKGEMPPLAGSTYYVENLEADFKKRIYAAVVVDMVGDEELTVVKEENSNHSLIKEIFAHADTLGYQEFFKENYKVKIVDDHLPFIENGIPAADIIDPFYPSPEKKSYWHTLEDRFDKISEKSLGIVGKTLELFVYNHSAQLSKKESWSDLTNTLSWKPQNENMSSNLSETTKEFGWLNITLPLTIENTQFFIYNRLFLSGREEPLVLRNCTFVSGTVKNDFYADISKNVVLDNCTFIFNNKERGVKYQRGERQNSLNIEGENLSFTYFSVYNTPGYAAFLKVKNFTLFGGVLSGSQLGGLVFLNSTAVLHSFLAKDNTEFALRAFSFSNISVKHSTFLSTFLEDTCSSCGPPPMAPAIEVENSFVSVRQTLFKSNHIGVGIISAKVEIENSKFLLNEWGVKSTESEIELKHSLFQHNTEGVRADASFLKIRNSEFKNHTTAVAISSSSHEKKNLIENSTFFSNEKAVALWYSSLRMVGNYISNSSFGCTLNMPENIMISNNTFKNNKNASLFSSMYEKDYPYLQNLSNNTFIKTEEYGILFIGALNPHLDNNTFLNSSEGAKEVVQQWRLHILVLNATAGTTIKVKRNDTFLQELTLKSGENSRTLLLDQYWIINGTRIEAGYYTVEVTRPDKDGEKTIILPSFLMETHQEKVAEFLED